MKWEDLTVEERLKDLDMRIKETNIRISVLAVIIILLELFRVF